MYKLLLPLVLLLVCSCDSGLSIESYDYYKKQKVTQTTDELRAELTTTIDAIANESDQYGMGVVVLSSDSIYYQQAFGKVSEKSEKDFSLETVMPIGSISKTLVGVSLLKAQELDLLNIEDDINSHLPFKLTNPHHPSEIIRIKHLATHTSSLEYTDQYERSYLFYGNLPDLDKDLKGEEKEEVRAMIDLYGQNEDVGLATFIKNIYTPEGTWYDESHYLKSKPGTEYAYCNENAAIASMIIEQVSGMDFASFTQKYILDPLDMDKSSWSIENYNDSERGELYMYHQPIPHYRLITFADGGFITNVSEFTKYFQALMNGYDGKESILSKVSFQTIFTKHYEEDDNATGIFMEFEDQTIGHSGGDPGIVTFAYFDPGTSFGYIVFMKTDEFSVVIRTLDRARRYAAHIATNES